MKNIQILILADQWHTMSSEQILGVFESVGGAVKSAHLHSDKSLTEDNLFDLETKGQTQGLEENYIIREYTLNQIEE